ncbi:hypothetical protein ACMFMG_002606 [Clarireedia jacksonii]
MPSAWDHAADRDMLLCIIEVGDIKSIQWDVVSQKMQAKGYTFTKEACRQRFQKIRRESKSHHPSTTPSSAETTPAKKRQRASKSKSTSTPTTSTSSRQKLGTYVFNGAEEEEEDDDEDDLLPSPQSKHMKQEVEFKDFEQQQQVRQIKIEKAGREGMVDLDDDRYVWSSLSWVDGVLMRGG